jgi:tetratricopeptide (TPR) repeat protein
MNESETSISVEARARGMLRRREFDAAIALLQSELEDESPDGDVLELLGMAYFFAQRNEQARDTFQQLTRNEPLRTNAWVNLGAVLNRIGEHKSAADALRRALQRDRKCAVAYYNLGIAQKAMKQNTMAISAYKEALKLRPAMTDAHMNLGKIYMVMNNPGGATQCFNAVLKHDPDSQKARTLLEDMRKTQKQIRRTESPFGRLVDEEALAAAQVSDTPRTMAASDRNDERDLCRKVSKEIRTGVREMVPALDDNLQSILQKLAVETLQSENRNSDPAAFNSLAETRMALQRMEQQIVSGCKQLREHLQQSNSNTD